MVSPRAPARSTSRHVDSIAAGHNAGMNDRIVSPAATREEDAIEASIRPKRLDEYLDGLFWISLLGIAFILGGAVLLKTVRFSDLVILIYAVLSSTVFLINFGFSLWGTLSLMRSSSSPRRRSNR